VGRFDIITGRAAISEPSIQVPEDAWYLFLPSFKNPIWFIPTCIDNFPGTNQKVVEFILKIEHYIRIKNDSKVDEPFDTPGEWLIQIKDKKIQFIPSYILIQIFQYHNIVRIKFGIPLNDTI
jgi:hypothetical protein